MINKDELDKQLKSIGFTNPSFSIKGEIKHLPEILHSNETLIALTKGFLDQAGGTSLIVVTSERVIFLRKGMIGSIYQFSIPLKKISSVDHKIGIMSGELAIWDGVTKLKVEHLDKKSLASFIVSLENAISNQSKEPSRQTLVIDNPKPIDVADQIKKLAELKEQGILTEEEFSEQKKKLLS